MNLHLIHRFTSWLLIVCISASLIPFSLAYESDKHTVAEQLTVCAPNELLTESYTTETTFRDVKKSPDGRYAIELTTSIGTEYLPVGRLDINLLDSSSVDNTLQRDDIPTEVKAEIQKKQERAIANGSNSASVSYFSSALMETQDGLTTRSNDSIYYTYQGHEMRSDRLYSYGDSTGWEYIVSGTKTETVTSALFNVAFSAAGLAFTSVSILSTGAAVIKAFTDLFGLGWITGHSSDYLQMRLFFDDIKQWTYGKTGSGWQLGLCTEKVTLLKVGHEQYYYNNGRGGELENSDRSVKQVMMSEHFDSPWATAWQWTTAPLTEWVTWKVHNKTFVF